VSSNFWLLPLPPSARPSSCSVRRCLFGSR